MRKPVAGGESRNCPRRSACSCTFLRRSTRKFVENNRHTSTACGAVVCITTCIFLCACCTDLNSSMQETFATRHGAVVLVRAVAKPVVLSPPSSSIPSNVHSLSCVATTCCNHVCGRGIPSSVITIVEVFLRGRWGKHIHKTQKKVLMHGLQGQAPNRTSELVSWMLTSVRPWGVILLKAPSSSLRCHSAMQICE